MRELMNRKTQYVIRGGVEGRERLRVLGRVMAESTGTLLDQVNLTEGMTCLDVGCGGGDVTCELARRVAPVGRVVGVDIDETKLSIARQEAAEQGLTNIEFRLSDASEISATPEFDLVYSRFLLTHLRDPVSAVRSFLKQLRPTGFLVVEDIDFSGSFNYPESPAFQKFFDLYNTVVRHRGGDPNIGQRLPGILHDCGIQNLKVSVVQPTGLQGEVKLLNGLTMENIADAILEDDLATPGEIDEIVKELYDYAADPRTLSGVPRVIQVWGRLPFA